MNKYTFSRRVTVAMISLMRLLLSKCYKLPYLSFVCVNLFVFFHCFVRAYFIIGLWAVEQAYT
jgi:hypothetical protein